MSAANLWHIDVLSKYTSPVHACSKPPVKWNEDVFVRDIAVPSSALAKHSALHVTLRLFHTHVHSVEQQ